MKVIIKSLSIFALLIATAAYAVNTSAISVSAAHSHSHNTIAMDPANAANDHHVAQAYDKTATDDDVSVVDDTQMEADATSHIAVLNPNDNHVEIRLAANNSTGYSWFVRDYNYHLLKLESYHYVEPTVTDLVGVRGTAVFVFSVNSGFYDAPQMTSIELVYGQTWQSDTLRTHTVVLASNDRATAMRPSTTTTKIATTTSYRFGGSSSTVQQPSNATSAAPHTAPHTALPQSTTVNQTQRVRMPALISDTQSPPPTTTQPVNNNNLNNNNQQQATTSSSRESWLRLPEAPAEQ